MPRCLLRVVSISRAIENHTYVDGATVEIVFPQDDGTDSTAGRFELAAYLLNEMCGRDVTTPIVIGDEFDLTLYPRSSIGG